jgi:hypothetical protein
MEENSMNLKRVFIFATLLMGVASIAFAQVNLTNNVLQMAVGNANIPLGNPLGTLDTTNNAVIIKSVQVSASPYTVWADVTTLPVGTPVGTAYDTLNFYAQTGFNNGWTGGGLISKGNPIDDTAYNDLSVTGTKAIGLMTVDDYENSIGYAPRFFHTSLAGYPTTAVLLRYTYLGDSDFDGAITAADVSTVLVSYNSGLPATWINGSTDYGQGPGGIIQSYDVSTVLVEYNSGLPAYNPPDTPPSAGGITPIPEPSTFVLLVIGVALLVLKRRLSK